MAKGDSKRTYKLTSEAVAIIDWMEENTILDKSDFTDRAVKYYWREYKNGNLNDPLLADAIEQASDVPDLDDGDDDDGGLLGRLRGKKE